MVGLLEGEVRSFRSRSYWLALLTTPCRSCSWSSASDIKSILENGNRMEGTVQHSSYPHLILNTYPVHKTGYHYSRNHHTLNTCRLSQSQKQHSTVASLQCSQCYRSPSSRATRAVLLQ